MDVDSYKEALDSAFELTREGRHGEAFQFVNGLIARGTITADLLVLRSQLVQLMTDDEIRRFPDATLESAEEGLRTACALAPDSPRPLLELAYFEYAVMERSEDALEHFDAARTLLEQDLRECLVGKARAFFDLGRNDDGWQEIARIRSHFPDFDATEVLGHSAVVEAEEED